jgi:hypothetical protein
MVKIKHFIGNSYDYVCALILVFLPFSASIPNLLLALLLLFYLLDFDFKYQSSYPKPFIFLSILIAYLFVKALLNGTFMVDFTYYKKYLYLILLPILFFKVNRLSMLKNVALLSINATVLVSCFKIMRFHSSFGYFPFGDGWATNFVLVLERPYAGIFSVLAAIISFDLMRKADKWKYLYALSLLLSVAFIAFISIRISILTLLFVFLLYVFLYSQLSLQRKLMLFGSMLVLVFALFAVNKNISKRFFIEKSLGKTIETTKQYEPRVVILACAKSIVEQPTFSYLFGTESNTAIQNSLTNCYKETVLDYSRQKWFLYQNFNTHSQFVDLFLLGGIVAILLFISFLFSYFMAVRRSFNAVAIGVAFLSILLIENVFHRQFGCFIFSIFTALYLREEVINGKIKS